MASGGGQEYGQGQTPKSGGKGQRQVRRHRQDGIPGGASNNSNLTWQQQQMVNSDSVNINIIVNFKFKGTYTVSKKKFTL